MTRRARSRAPIRLYTIGFTRLSAEDFFTMLETNGVARVIDVRANNKGQLAGFTKEGDLRFFLGRLAGISYEHWTQCAPPQELLKNYRAGDIDWVEYASRYQQMLRERRVVEDIDILSLNRSCLLCSERTPEQCHRRLLSEHIQERFDGVEVVHL